MSSRARTLLLLLALAFATELPADNPQMVTRSFKVTPAFLPDSDLDKPSGSDPFAGRQRQGKPLKQLLEEAGIAFPEGSSVFHGPNGEIVCSNTEDNLERLRKFIDSQNAAANMSAGSPALITRTFRIPPDYPGTSGGDAGVTAPADPFAATPEQPPQTPERKTAREIIEAYGISFPAGAGATFDPVTGFLTVTNTLQNLDLVESLVAEIIGPTPRVIACSVTVIEGTGEVIRQAVAAASRKTDAREELATLLGQANDPKSNVRVVGDAFLETKSGTRASSDAIREHIYASELEMDAKSRSSVAQEMRHVGLRLAYEPTLGADGVTIESTLSLELHTAPPVERQVTVTEPVTGGTAEFPTTEVHAAHFVTGISSVSGSVKLIGVTKPVGTPAENDDILWAAFVTPTVHTSQKPVPPQAADFSPPRPVPPGMKAAALPMPRGLLLKEMVFDEAGQPPRTLPLQKWFEASGVPHVEGASIHLTDDAAQVINTPDNIERMAMVIEDQLNQFPKTVAFTIHTVQAPAAFLRGWALKPSATADDSAMFAAVEKAVERGEAQFIDSRFVETKSGNRAILESKREHVYLSEFGTDAKGQPQVAFEMRPVGSIFEVEPTVGVDGRTVEITFAHELHPAPPEERRDHFRDAASNKAFEMPVVDFHSTKTVTGISMPAGGIRLISLNRPTGRADADVLWATFLKCDLVSHVPQPRPVEEEPERRDAPSTDPKSWNTARYRVPPDFLTIGGGEAAPTDPFAPLPAGDGSGLIARKTAKMILESLGIFFPEGATAVFNPAASILFVKNTNENLDLVEAFVDTILWDPPITVAFTAHVLQGPGPLLRRLTAQAASKADNRAELDELLAAVKTGTVRHLNTAHIETKSGARATSEQASEHQAVGEVGISEKGEPFFKQEMHMIGLVFELEPLVGADGATVELTLAPEFHTAPSFEHREFVIDTQGRRLEFPLTDYFVSKTTTGITIIDGSARLLSLYKPTGKPEFEKEDILQAIFITCDVLRAGE